MVESVDVEEMGDTPVPAFAAFRVSNRALHASKTTLSKSHRNSDANDGFKVPMGRWALTKGNLQPIGKETERSALWEKEEGASPDED